MAKSARRISRPTEEKALANIRRWERKQQDHKKIEEMRLWRVVRTSSDEVKVVEAKRVLGIEP